MHPFSLKQENTKEVTGGVYQVVTLGIDETGGCIPQPFPFPPQATTLALGEEGGFPIDQKF
ncbi:hypothetical protein [Aliiglaciecola litoralis]|uniref:Uncharacterized protein n=1 Tax=Aliiglaciecola litoralis TaxID=582857 RepID=A0ABP3WRD9_9ALTE